MIGAGVAKRRRGGAPGKHRFTRRVVLVLGLLSLTTGKPMTVLADLAAWKPVFAKYGGRLTLQSVYATNGTRTNQNLNDTTTRQGFRESLSLGTIGYVYHPDLMFFDLSGTYGQDQTKVYQEESTTNSRGGYDAYDLSALFLRKKPYTLELFTSQDKPFTSSAIDDDQEVTQESGAEFNYKKRVYNAKLQYKNTQRSSGNREDTTDDFDAIADFSKPRLGWLENFAINGTARYQEDTNLTNQGNGGKLTSQDTGLSNRFDYKIFNFITNLNNYTTTINDFGSGRGQGNANLLSFSEGINADLPWNFTSDVWIAKTASDDSNSQPTTTQESSLDTDQFKFTLVQRLYESLVTQLTANLDSAQSLITERVTGSTGETIELAPVKGSNEQESFILESRYTKKLPHQSLLSGRLATRNTQITRTGLSSEAKVFTSVRDNGGIIALPDNTDTAGAITVDVLRVNLRKHPNDICKEAVNNPRAVSSSCWIPLLEANDYTLESFPRPTITIDTISDNPDFADIYNTEFTNPDNTHGPFTFRVTMYLKAADLTTQTNLASVGLILFEAVSSRYEHAVTSQEGSYGGSTLEPKVTEDTVSLGFSTESLTTEVSRQWINSSGLETINEFRIFYTKSRKFFQLLTVDLNAEAHTAAADIADEQRDDIRQSSEDGYSYSLGGTMPIPYINVALKVGNGYSYTRGAIDRLSLNTEGVSVTTQDLGIGRRAIMRNTVELSKPFKIPWIEFVANSYARYRWETTTGDYDRERLTLQYGVNAGRAWRFGATTINLKANFAISDDVYDEGGGIRREQLTLLRREEESENTSVVLTIARQLF